MAGKAHLRPTTIWRMLVLFFAKAIVLSSALLAQANLCYQATIDKKTITYTGDVWRQILNQAAQRRVASNKEPLDPLPANQKPTPRIKKCLGAVDPTLVNAPDLYYQDPNIVRNDAKYFGMVTSAGMFRKLAEMQCGAKASYPHQFFMIGSTVLYRYCGGGDHNGYVYFWGWTDKSDSQCLNDTYPGMYKVIDDSRPKGQKVPRFSLDDVRAAETKGDLGKTLDKGTAALAADVAAQMVAESYRDSNLKYLNLMLLDIAKARKADADSILAGYCPIGVSATQCQNPNGRGKGYHPIAWGGAQAVMMAGKAWGRDAGANSAFGMNYEAGLIGQWLIDTQKGKPLTGATCTATLPSEKDPDRITVTKLFNSLSGN